MTDAAKTPDTLAEATATLHAVIAQSPISATGTPYQLLLSAAAAEIDPSNRFVAEALLALLCMDLSARASGAPGFNTHARAFASSAYRIGAMGLATYLRGSDTGPEESTL